MDDFWNNILRYPRFFITSLAGLTFIILAPLKNLLKIKKLRFVLLITLGLFFLMLFKVIENMTGL